MSDPQPVREPDVSGETAYFLSDLHFSRSRPEKIELFARFLRALGGNGRVYMLGDLFEEFWIGMDDDMGCGHEIVRICREYADAGGELSVLRGNHDFYLDAAFAQASGCRLLPEPVELRLDGRLVQLMHGDVLCVQDRSYQRWRRFITARGTRALFMSLPVSWRRGISRGTSRSMRMRDKPAEITDVDETYVRRYMHERGLDVLIHGHTHRLGQHSYECDGWTGQRMVLGDWYEKDSVLVWRQGEGRLLRVEDCLRQLPQEV